MPKPILFVANVISVHVKDLLFLGVIMSRLHAIQKHRKNWTVPSASAVFK